MTTKKSRFAPDQPIAVHNVDGVLQATVCCGIKNRQKDDLLLVKLVEGTTVGGVFTRSSTAAAPVDWCRRILKRGTARGLVVNSGNANAFSGVAGMLMVEQEALAAGLALGSDPDDVFIASTGVIGEQLPVDRIVEQLPTLSSHLRPDSWVKAASSIMTTDTFCKLASRKLRIGDTEVSISGYSKGAGMIMPNMATMLCFVYTDACLPADLLQQLVTDGMQNSFHAITVDSDTSTNDTVLLFATGQARHTEVRGVEDPILAEFREGLFDCFHELAMQVVSDAEGITKLVAITVEGASSDADARTIAMSVANSPLVKTAFAGQDANWGRVVMAVGKSGVALDKRKLSIAFGEHQLAVNGNPIAMSSTVAVDDYMKQDKLAVNVNVGDGDGKSTVWTSDLSHEYVSINADYRS